MTRLEPTSDEERWTAIVAAEGRGAKVAREDLAFRERFEAANPERTGEAQLWTRLGQLGGPRGGAEMSDEDLAARVLAEMSDESAPRSGARQSTHHAAPSMPIGAGDASQIQADPTPRSIFDQPSMRTARADEEPLRAPAPLRQRPLVRRGIAGALAATLLAATLLVAFASELLGTRAKAPAAQPDAGNAPSASATAPRPSLNAGAPVPAFEATTDDGASAADAGSAEPSPPKHDEAPAGAREPAPALPAARAPTADALLREAQTMLAAGRAQDAAAAYRALLARHPSSAEARAATVSLGRLSLAAGDAAAALAYFDRYLAGSGPLGVEARHGRIQALRRLGRTADEKAAIDDFLARHGDSVHADRLRARAESLSRP